MNRFRITGMALVVLLICAMLFTGCPNAAQAKKPEPPAPPAAPQYVKVAYGELDAYLRDKASSTAVNYIEITGDIPKDDFKGTLGQTLRNHSDKKVALKIAKYPEGLTSMKQCFGGCTSLISLAHLPQGLENMESCFSGCSNLKESPHIPDTVTNMVQSFIDCTSLAAAPSIPSKVDELYSTFDHCTSLTTAPPRIAEGVRTMNNTFFECTALTRVPSIPSTVTSMMSCFSGCTELTTVAPIPQNVQRMFDCFANCESLISVTLKCNYPGNSNVTSCFAGCRSLTTGGIKVPQDQLGAYQTGAPDMGTTADKFDGIYNRVEYANLEAYLSSASNAYVNFIEITGSIPKEDFKGNEFAPGALGQKLKDHSTKKVALKIAAYPVGLTDMSCCFYGCTSLITAPEIPQGVKNMNTCFGNCENLIQAPKIPESVTDMRHCFQYCKNLTQVPEIPQNVTDMERCFRVCKNLEHVPPIPARVTGMKECFHSCTKLTGVTLKCSYKDGSFGQAFAACNALTSGSIKVPQDQLGAYQTGAPDMGTTAEKFAASN